MDQKVTGLMSTHPSPVSPHHQIYQNQSIGIRTDPLFTWMVATRDGWWPLDQVDQGTLRYLSSFSKDERLPYEFHRYVAELLKVDPAIRRREYDNMPLLHGARIDRE